MWPQRELPKHVPDDWYLIIQLIQCLWSVSSSNNPDTTGRMVKVLETSSPARQCLMVCMVIMHGALILMIKVVDYTLNIMCVETSCWWGIYSNGFSSKPIATTHLKGMYLTSFIHYSNYNYDHLCNHYRNLSNQRSVLKSSILSKRW